MMLTTRTRALAPLPLRFRPRSEGERDIRDYLDGQVVFFAGAANSIMQLGWPAVGHGVVHGAVESGSVMKHPRKRLRTTVTHLAVAMLGAEGERAAWRGAVNSQHRQVRSAPDAPVKYNAFSKDLQLWVTACLYYGTVDAYQRFHGPLDAETADWLYHYCARLGTTLQMTPDQWPADRRAFDDYWRDAVGKVHYDDEVKAYLNGLLDLQQLSGRAQRKHATFYRWVNTGFLPSEFRAAMDLAWSVEDQAKHDAFCRRHGEKSLRRPRVWRNFPFNLYLADFRLRRLTGRPLV
jgi:uncharacterized protein (DUF2236 family)